MEVIPGWCDSPSIIINGNAINEKPTDDGFVKISRQWKDGDTIVMNLPMQVKIERGKTTPVPDTAYYEQDNRATPITKVTRYGQPYASVHLGPLLFALPLADETPNKAKEGSTWNYALDIDKGKATRQATLTRDPMPDNFHWQIDSPLKVTVPAIQFDWNPNNSQPLPNNPVQNGDSKKITLVPYGATKFRVSMFPVAADTSQKQNTP